MCLIMWRKWYPINWFIASYNLRERFNTKGIWSIFHYLRNEIERIMMTSLKQIETYWNNTFQKIRLFHNGIAAKVIRHLYNINLSKWEKWSRIQIEKHKTNVFRFCIFQQCADDIRTFAEINEAHLFGCFVKRTTNFFQITLNQGEIKVGYFSVVIYAVVKSKSKAIILTVVKRLL